MYCLNPPLQEPPEGTVLTCFEIEYYINPQKNCLVNLQKQLLTYISSTAFSKDMSNNFTGTSEFLECFEYFWDHQILGHNCSHIFLVFQEVGVAIYVLSSFMEGNSRNSHRSAMYIAYIIFCC